MFKLEGKLVTVMKYKYSYPIPEERIRQFEEMAFGIFVHWGLYSINARGEWSMPLHQISKEEYAKLADRFDASEYDPKRFVQNVKNAGAKYITLTSKHHEGFFLNDAKGLSDFDAVSHAPKRDLLREFVAACNEEDIVPLFYYATYEYDNPLWHDDFEEGYLNYIRDSVELLCTNYGKIGGLWFDGNWARGDADWRLDELYSMIRKHQPEAMIIENTGLHAHGKISHPEIDSVTFEQGLPQPLDRTGHLKYVAGEMCQTTNNHWGIAQMDLNYKSTKELIETLCACRKLGANYLMNVGPDEDGNMTKMQEAILEVIGKWMAIHSVAIYKGKPCEVATSEKKDFALKDNDGYIYLFIHDLDIVADANVIRHRDFKTPRQFVNIKQKIKRIEWMDNGEDLLFAQDTEAGELILHPTHYPYGTDLVVRVAKIYND